MKEADSVPPLHELPEKVATYIRVNARLSKTLHSVIRGTVENHITNENFGVFYLFKNQEASAAPLLIKEDGNPTQLNDISGRLFKVTGCAIRNKKDPARLFCILNSPSTPTAERGEPHAAAGASSLPDAFFSPAAAATRAYSQILIDVPTGDPKDPLKKSNRTNIREACNKTAGATYSLQELRALFQAASDGEYVRPYDLKHSAASGRFGRPSQAWQGNCLENINRPENACCGTRAWALHMNGRTQPHILLLLDPDKIRFCDLSPADVAGLCGDRIVGQIRSALEVEREENDDGSYTPWHVASSRYLAIRHSAAVFEFNGRQLPLSCTNKSSAGGECCLRHAAQSGAITPMTPEKSAELITALDIPGQEGEDTDAYAVLVRCEGTEYFLLLCTEGILAYNRANPGPCKAEDLCAAAADNKPIQVLSAARVQRKEARVQFYCPWEIAPILAP